MLAVVVKAGETSVASDESVIDADAGVEGTDETPVAADNNIAL